MRGLGIRSSTLYSENERARKSTGSVDRSLDLHLLRSAQRCYPRRTSLLRKRSLRRRPQKRLYPATVRSLLSSPARASPAPRSQPRCPPGQFRDVFTLADAGSPQIELHGIDSVAHLHFTLPQTHVVRAAKIHFSYVFSPSLLPQLSQIKLIMNGTLFATIQPKPGETGGSDGGEAEADFTIPPELMVHHNALTIRVHRPLHTGLRRSRPTPRSGHESIATPTLEFDGDLLPLADDLKRLPLPFLDPAAFILRRVPIVFARLPPSKPFRPQAS